MPNLHAVALFPILTAGLVVFNVKVALYAFPRVFFHDAGVCLKTTGSVFFCAQSPQVCLTATIPAIVPPGGHQPIKNK